MDNFVAIDVETANGEWTSICSVGAVKVLGGRIVDSRYSLVNPEPNYYSYFCTRVHGLCKDDTRDAPPFGTVWQKWQDWFEGLPLVAHNAPFDAGCISAACRMYGVEPPPQPFFDTLSAARRAIPRAICPSKALDALCDFFGIPFKDHHNALADAEACAKLAMILL